MVDRPFKMMSPSSGSATKLMEAFSFFYPVSKAFNQAVRESIFEARVAKGAMLTHGNMVANVLQASAWITPLSLSDQDIIDDYCLTEVFLKERLLSMRNSDQIRGLGVPDEILDEMLGSKAHNMEKFLEYLDDNYSGADEYLQTIGLSRDEIEIIKSRMLKEN